MSTHPDRLRLTGLISGMLLGSLAAAPIAAISSELEEHLWRHRLLFVVAPDSTDPGVLKQLRRLRNRAAAIEDRDIRIYQIYSRGGSSYQSLPLDKEASMRIRDVLAVDNDTKALVLVGKDGGVKRRAPLNSDLRDFFVQIDGMPMRQLEIREKREAGLPVTRP